MSAGSQFRVRGCATACLGAVLALAGPAAAADWPQFRGPGRDGVAPEAGRVRAWGEKGPPVAWARKAGPGYSGPVVAGGRLILFHRVGNKEVVQCLDAAGGKPRWDFSYPTAYEDDFGKGDGPRSTPVVAGGHVYTLGAEGALHCLDLRTGKKVWGRRLNQEYKVPKNFFGVGTTPLVEGGLVLVNVGGRGAGIVAFDKDTGKEVWKATDDAASYSSPVAATFHGTRYAIFLTREGVVFLDPRTGKVRFRKRWRSPMGASVNAASPVVAGDLVFFSASYGTGALLLRVARGGFEEVWKGDEVLSSHYETPVHYQGHLYGFDGRQETGARLRCVELQTGKVCWTKEGFGCGSMLRAGGDLIILTEAGDLVLVEATPKAYREKARAEVLAGTCRAPIALAGGRLYLRNDQKLLCLDLNKK